MGRKNFRSWAVAIFYLARKTGFRHCQHDNFYLPGVDNNQLGEHVVKNFAASTDLDFLEPVPIFGGVAYEFILANGRVQLYVDVVFPIIFLDAVCQSIEVG